MAPGFGLLGGHPAVSLPIKLVSNQQKGEVLRVFCLRMLLATFPPLLEILEALSVGDVKHEGARIGTTVEREPEGLIFLLPGGVPDLQIDDGPFNHYLLLPEVSADGGLSRHRRQLVDVLL